MKTTALVTGADRGLGSALCAGLLARGWRVLAGQYMPDWPELAALAEQYPGLLHILPLDVGSTKSVQAAARQAAGVTSHVDLLISNAGISSGRSQLGQGLDYSRMQQAFNVNAVGAIVTVPDMEIWFVLLLITTLAGCSGVMNSGVCKTRSMKRVGLASS